MNDYIPFGSRIIDSKERKKKFYSELDQKKIITEETEPLLLIFEDILDNCLEKEIKVRKNNAHNYYIAHTKECKARTKKWVELNRKKYYKYIAEYAKKKKQEMKINDGTHSGLQKIEL